MASSPSSVGQATSGRRLRVRSVIVLVAGGIVLGACGESGIEVPSGASALGPTGSASPASAPPSGSPKSSPSGSADQAALLAALLDPGLVPFMVAGHVTAGGHTWTIPATFFAQDLTVEEPVPVLSNCAVVGASRRTGDRATPTVMVGHQTMLDMSAGDHVSFAFDGEILTGGGYPHGSGEEWAWSVQQVAVTYEQLVVEALEESYIAVHVAWAGEAGENFTAEKDAVVGSATCYVAPAHVVSELIDWHEELTQAAQKADEEAHDLLVEAYGWPSRPALPPQEPTHRHAEVIGDSAHEVALYPPDDYDDIVEHYTETFGRPPDFDDFDDGGTDLVQWAHNAPGTPQSLTSVSKRSNAVVVTQNWNAP